LRRANNKKKRMEGVVAIRQIENKSIPVDLIEVGPRYRKPSGAEIDKLAKSIEQDGLLAPISVQANGDRLRLVTGATRLAAVKKLGSVDILAVVVEGTEEEFEIAELVENLERLHLTKDQREEWTQKLVELRAKAERGAQGKQLNDRLSFNCFRGSKTRPKTKVDGATRGRPVTAEAKAKKEVAAQTRQSLRAVQRATWGCAARL
jgi:hypothetical protein